MKKKEKKGLLILIVVAVLIIGAIWLMTRGDNGEQVATDGNGKEPIVKVEEDGTKVNVSEKLNKDKVNSGFEISNISYTQSNGETILKARITNRTGSEQSEFFGKIVLLDKSGKTIGNIPIMVSATQDGEATDVEATITEDYVEAYDFRLEK